MPVYLLVVLGSIAQVFEILQNVETVEVEVSSELGAYLTDPGCLHAGDENEVDGRSCFRIDNDVAQFEILFRQVCVFLLVLHTGN